MEPSDDSPLCVVRFKKVFTTDLAERRNSTNLTWLKITLALDPRFKDVKCLPKAERSEVRASVCNLVMYASPAQQPSAETTEEQPPKKRRMSLFLLRSSDMDTDKGEESIEQCVDRYKAEPKMDMEGCPLQHTSTPATKVPCETLFIIPKKRAALSPDHVNRLVLLSNWMNVKED
ncbi:hypothetical protein F2P81_006327 [Scophthalmus maximus]|uniref:Uncharacterized protein n=1 Tax=Scophthalmus maximus TaxID=52904 RepID=A0A6A4T6D1_SCOMX|nr:hypothetical protein F2P81_006327 [Scophthalmus maximus]